MRALFLLALLGCGRSGAIAEGDLAKLRPGCTYKDVVKAFGPGQPTEFPVIVYPAWESEDQYLFVFNGQSLQEVLRLSSPDNTTVRVWPPP